MRRLAATLAALLALAAPAAAAECPRTSVADVEDEVMCPVCGTPLSLATEAPQARRERELVLRLVERCRSKAEIKSALAAEFGDDVLALPDDEGFDLAAYIVPIAAFLLAAALLALAIPRWRRRRPATPAAGAAELDEPDAERLRDDMARYD